MKLENLTGQNGSFLLTGKSKQTKNLAAVPSGTWFSFILSAFSWNVLMVANSVTADMYGFKSQMS